MATSESNGEHLSPPPHPPRSKTHVAFKHGKVIQLMIGYDILIQ